jgi:hypothetical protein
MKLDNGHFRAFVIWSALTLGSFNLLAGKEPLYDGLGSYSRKITTNSAEAQRYFDQGLGFSTDSITAPRSVHSSKPRNSILNAQ